MLKLAQNALPAAGLACRETITIPLNLFTHVSFIIVTHCMVVTSQMGGSHLREQAREQLCDNRVHVENVFWAVICVLSSVDRRDISPSRSQL